MLGIKTDKINTKLLCYYRDSMGSRQVRFRRLKPFFLFFFSFLFFFFFFSKKIGLLATTKFELTQGLAAGN